MNRCRYIGCSRKYYAKGLCGTHYNRERTGVDPLKRIKVFIEDPKEHRKHLLGRSKEWRKSVRKTKPEWQCVYGICRKAREMGRQCYDCWLKAKWRGMKQRIENRNGKSPTYEGLPMEFTQKQFVKWGRENRPDPRMANPSIDKIIDSKGYVPGNIRWLPLLVNLRQNQKDVPEGFWKCTKCQQVKPHTFEFFSRHAGRPHGLHSSCRPCYNAHMVNYRHSRRISQAGVFS